MSELEDRLGAVLNNPQMMQQILSMAKALGQQNSPAGPDAAQPEPQPEPPPQEAASPAGTASASFPELDLGMLQKITQLAGRSRVDQNQQNLLAALSPYLSPSRVKKLEKAMRAAKLAGMASSFLNAGGLQGIFGR